MTGQGHRRRRARCGGRPGGLENIQLNQTLGLATPESRAVDFIDANRNLANQKQPALHPADVETRLSLAQALCDAIAEAYPGDAVQIMAAALADLTPGGARPDFFLSAEAEARWWASIETPEVLVRVLRVALENLGNRAMHRETRKRLFMALWHGFSLEEQGRFLSFARGEP